MARMPREVRELAGELVSLQRQVRDLATTPQLGRSSLDDESINTYDSDGNLRARYGLQHDGTYTAAVLDGPVPPVPSVPTVSGGPGELSVTWDGTYVDDARAPMDFHVVEVWAADTDFSDRSEARLLGHFANESGGDITVARPVGEWHVALVSKAQSGRRSAVSGRAVAVVESVVDQGALDELDDKIDQAEQDLSDARDRLGAAEGSITDAFGQIDTLGDDVSAASLAAAAAQADASQAISDAQSAQQAADAAWGEAAGKAKSYWSNTPPTPPAEGFNRGDLWHRTVAQGDVAEYAWTGTPDESTSTRTTASGTVTNVVPNPNMVASTEEVTVFANYAQNPSSEDEAMTPAASSGYYLTRVTGAVSPKYGSWVSRFLTDVGNPVPDVIGIRDSGVPARDDLGDNTVHVSIWVRVQSEEVAKYLKFRIRHGNNSRPIPNPDPGGEGFPVGEWFQVEGWVQLAPTKEDVIVELLLDEVDQEDRDLRANNIDLDGLHIVAGTLPPAGYFDKDIAEEYAGDPDLTRGDLPDGGVRLYGYAVEGMTEFFPGGVLIASSQWAKSGPTSLRIINTSGEAYLVYAAINSDLVTGSVWRYLEAPLTLNDEEGSFPEGLLLATSGLELSLPEEIPPNSPGEHLIRVSRDTGDPEWALMALSGPSEFGESVWFDLLTLTEEPYDGPPFSGSTVERAGRQTQVWSGTYWDDLTDGAIMEALEAADAAQRAADAAHDAAGSAQDAADLALQAAGSKSTITYSTSAPAGNGQREGDTHRQRDASHNIIAEWRWTGSAWQKQEIKSEMISNLDVGKLTAGSAEISEVVAQSIAAATAAFIELDVENLFVTGTSTVNEQVAQAIWVAKLAAQKVLASEIATESLAADQGFISVLNSAEIVGAVIKTAESGTRVELDSGHGIRIFSDDTEVFNIDSSTGGIAMRGRLIYGDSDGHMLDVGESANKWGSYMPGIRFGGYGQGISEQSPALRGDINEIELVGGPAWIRIEHGLQNPYISMGVENPALTIYEDAVYLPRGANIFPTTYERDIGSTNPPDGTQAWTGSGNNLQEWIRVNGAWERKTPHGWEETNLQTYVATSFTTRDLMGYTDGHTVVIRGILGGGNITQGGMDITRTAIPTNLRPGPGNWQGACWVNGGHPSLAFVRENGTISVVQRSGGNVSGAQFVITYPRI